MKSILWLPFAIAVSAVHAAPITPIERRIPPPGKPLDEAQTREVHSALAHLDERMQRAPERLDIAAVHKAIRFAMENGEFYDPPKDLKKIKDLLRAADAPTAKRGLGIRGYRSGIDGSIQPYGIDVPADLDLSKRAPVWIWLHGRGDKETDLHFLHNRLTKGGQFRPQDAIVLHPFGRQCIGWKHAGEIDVLEAIVALGKEFNIDTSRFALCGFSMGGAGAWHIGAHYTRLFRVVHAGAGFAETAEYIGLKQAEYPPPWEQQLWGQYDAPAYARNLLNIPVIAYSGENDKQIQAARVMERALADHGQTLKHVIGPGTGHKYHPDSAALIEGYVRAALQPERTSLPAHVHLQTRTLRYCEMHGVRATGLEKHWADSRIDVQRTGGTIRIDTTNISSFNFTCRKVEAAKGVSIDGQKIATPDQLTVSVIKRGDRWELGEHDATTPRKSQFRQGPIDDAFMAPFLVALPPAQPKSALHARWVEFELAHFKKRWKELFRGELRTKREDDLTEDDHNSFHIIAWGTSDSSELVRSVMAHAPEHDAENQIVAMVRPNPRNPEKYLVINSGPTFREAHDRTNSLQNPKLGDWAVIDLRTDPDAEAPGKVISSGFFDEQWR